MNTNASIRKKRIRSISHVILVILLVCTFFSKTIYSFNLPKVTVKRPSPATFRETTTITSGTLDTHEGESRSLLFTGGNMTAVRVGQNCTIIGIKEDRYSKSIGTVSKKREGEVWVSIPESSSFDETAHGFIAEVTLFEHTAEQAVPSSALISSDQLYVIRERTGIFGPEYSVLPRIIIKGSSDELVTEIVEGLEYDDIVVIGWSKAIGSGTVVEILD